MKKPIRNIFKEVPESAHHETVQLHRLVKANGLSGRLATYNYAWLAPGGSFEAHAHPDCEEYFLILNGRGNLLLSQEKDASPTINRVVRGDFITVPKNYFHSLKNISQTELVFLSLRVIIDSP